MSRTENCDIIVVGGGSAAFEAAIAARQAGAENVVMLEKATPDDFGGNARYSHTGFRCVYNSPDEIRGSVHDTGEVLMGLLGVGAKAAGHWQGCHATPIDANARDGGTPMREDGHGNSANRYDYMYGITVNGLGQRFYDEGESNHAYTYAKTGREVLAQPGGVAFQIFDAPALQIFRLGPEYTDTYEEAPTLAELAHKIGLQPELLEHTVAEYNGACRMDVPFDPSKLDGKSTQGIAPIKSNWAVPIVEPPFRAYPITCGVTFSFGGLQINTNTEVLNTSGKPIRGLYASGDIVGLFFHNYPSCTGQVRNAVFSLTAGRNAVKNAN